MPLYLFYERYLKNVTQNSFDDNSCPVCYIDDKFIKTKLICGHIVCLDCIMHTISHTKRCPICNELINIKKIAIIFSM